MTTQLANASFGVLEGMAGASGRGFIEDARTFQSIRRAHGMLERLMAGFEYETVSTMMARLFKMSSYDLSKAERAIVFLDNMHKLGVNAVEVGKNQEEISKQILKDLLGKSSKISLG